MTGNVWEWCSDWYAADYYSKSPNRNPENTTAADYRVLRGGSWYYIPQRCRVADRGNYAPATRRNSYGFRVCLAPQL